MADEKKPEKEKPKYPYEVPEDKKQPQFVVGHWLIHTPREFHLDFAYLDPSKNKLVVAARLVMTREHLIELIFNLQKQLAKFDKKKKPKPPDLGNRLGKRD